MDRSSTTTLCLTVAALSAWGASRAVADPQLTLVRSPLVAALIGQAQDDPDELKKSADAFYTAKNYDKAIPLLDRAIKAKPDFVAGYFLRGQCFYAMNNTAKALTDFAKVTEMRPKVAQGWYNRGIVETAPPTPNYPAAIASFSKVIELNPKPRPNDPVNLVLESYDKRAVCYIQTNQLPQAIADCQQALSLDPKRSVTHYNLAFAYTKVTPKQVDKAIAEYSAALEGAAPAARLDIFLGRAELLIDQKKYAEAVTDLTNALKEKPDNVDGYNQRAAANFQLNKFAEAEADYNMVLKLKPGGEVENEAYRNRAAVYLKTKTFDKAIADLTEYLRRKPTAEADIYKLRGAAYMNVKPINYAGAIADYQKYLAGKPTDAVAWKDLSVASYGSAGVPPKDGPALDQAIAAADKASQYDANLPEPYLIKGEALSVKGRYADAIPIYTNYIGKKPDEMAGYYGRGIAYYNSKQWANANKDFDAYLAKNPTDQETVKAVRVYKANALTQLGGPEAEGALDKAIAENPTNADLWTNRGAIRFAAKRYDDAIKDFQKAVDLAPTNIANLKNLANALTAKAGQSKADGDVNAAIAAYGKVLAAKPNDPDSLAARGDLNLAGKKYADAAKDYTAFIAASPTAKEIVAVYNNRAIAYTNMTPPNYQGAVQDYTQVITRQPNDPAAYNLRALAYLNMAPKDYKSAIADLDKFLQMKAGDPDALLNRASASFNLGLAMKDTPTKGAAEFDKAIADYTAFLALPGKATDGPALFSRGLAHYRKGGVKDKNELKAAITDFEAAVKAKADVADYHYYLGLASDNLGVESESIREDMFAKAIASYEKFVSMPGVKPEDATVVKKRIAELKEALGG